MQVASAGAEQFDDGSALREYAKTQDPRAFEFLVKRYQAMVLATCVRATQSRADAEDATQETFVKLAQNARHIRANVAAWLHACAMHTSVDLIRKRASGRKAEIRAMDGRSDSSQAAGGETERTWEELRPIIDAALAELSDADRDLIVSRYFVGQNEAEIAQEQGVHPGTVSRRLSRAVHALRAKVARAQAAGGAALSAGALASALTLARAPEVSAEVASSIMRIGVAGIGAGDAGGVGGAGGTLGLVAGTGLSATGVKLAAVAAVVLLGGVSLLAWQGLTGGAAPGGSRVGASPAQDATGPRGVVRPTRAGVALAMTADLVDGEPRTELVCTGNELRLFGRHPDGSGPRINMTIEAQNWESEPPLLSLLLVSAQAEESPFASMVGQRFDAQCVVKENTVQLTALLPSEAEQGGGRMVWRGVRWGVAPVGARSMLEGRWQEVPGWTLTMEPDELTIRAGDFVLARYRILEWVEEPSVSRVRLICVRNVDARLIGSRVRALLAEQDGQLRLLMHEGDAKKLDIELDGLRAVQGRGVREMRFAKGAR